MARLFENQDGSDWAVLNCDDSNVWKLARSVRSRVFGFGFVPGGKPGIWPEGNALVFDMGSRRGRISLEGFRLPGRHNVSDAMAAAAGALAMFADERVIEQTLRGFVGLPHRIELVHEQDGVKWIDDAKATNVGAVVVALDAVVAPVILIAGGLDNGADYTPLIGPIHRKVKCAILNGGARKNLAAMLTGATQIELVPGLQEAVERAAAIALPGDTVLLSPACSSFDQFRDYAELGDVFKELVRAIP
jgi:UDP-N-acetylmuramoylalanine--D-glutamate ligase